ncbi:hypothetical protein MASR2M50_02290 [Thauera sp.]
MLTGGDDMESAPASGDAHPLRVVALIYLCGALLFGTLLALEWRLIDRTVAAIARERGAALFSLIETTREWNAMHGGVYVVVDGATQPNPWLEHPARDLQTSDGVRLTMVNPAYMTRQIADLALHADGARLHITSLKPIRPENLADDWEADALARFEAGEREVLALVEGAEEGRGPVHRYMAPLVVREPCLQCHAEQGYVLGDIRGGISVTMPAGVLIARRDQLRTRAVFIYVLAGLLAAGLVHGLLRANRRHVAQVRFDQRRTGAPDRAPHGRTRRGQPPPRRRGRAAPPQRAAPGGERVALPRDLRQRGRGHHADRRSAAHRPGQSRLQRDHRLRGGRSPRPHAVHARLRAP